VSSAYRRRRPITTERNAMTLRLAERWFERKRIDDDITMVWSSSPQTTKNRQVD